MKERQNRKVSRGFRHARVRRKVTGTPDRPRMALTASNRHLYVQFVDDTNGVTLASASSEKIEGAKKNIATANTVGQMAATAAKEQGITRVVIDRGGFKFHGRIKAIVDAAIAQGLKIRSEEAS
ncbi:MAG: 50S ribosomal protein L18 [Lentisphaerae bacterium]|nr:50S ribosomal protein L18 [Lentisphaerota bacterium]